MIAAPHFSARAYAFIVAYVREKSVKLGGVPGEQVTLAACARGHGTAGGHLQGEGA